MKRITLFIYTFFCITTVILAQARATFNKETHRFGQIEWKKPVTVDFTVTNSGDRPLVLNNVTVSCACAVTDWTKNPIAPGANGTISATFDAKQLGRFHKSIGVYTNAEPHLVYLHFEGEVVQKVTDFSNLNFESIGDILISQTEIDFPNAYRGENQMIQITVVNQSMMPYEPVLMHLPLYLSMTTEPTVLQKGEMGTIKLRLDTDKLTDLGLTQTSVYLSRFSGDKVSDENEIPVSVVLLPDFSDLSEFDRRNAPGIALSETTIDLSEVLKKKQKVKHDVIITNTGKSTLEISKLQVFNPAVGVQLRKASLKPGEQTKLRITFDKRSLTNKRRHTRVMLITNDPMNPKSIIQLQLEQNPKK